MRSNVLEGCIVRLDTMDEIQCTRRLYSKIRSNVLEGCIVRLDTMDGLQCTRRLYSKIRYSGWAPMY